MSITEHVDLDTPIIRGEQTITSVEVRKPASGELRGVSLSDVLKMDVQALIKVVPRVTTPTLTEQDVARMDAADLLQIGSTVAAFLLPKATRAEASLSS